MDCQARGFKMLASSVMSLCLSKHKFKVLNQIIGAWKLRLLWLDMKGALWSLKIGVIRQQLVFANPETEDKQQRFKHSQRVIVNNRP